MQDLLDVCIRLLEGASDCLASDCRVLCTLRRQGLPELAWRPCTAQVLQVVGVNVQPLLAAGGVSGIAIGFGAQKLTQNVLSGAKLFLTQPFVVGERVRLLGSGGGEVVSGIIETVSCWFAPVLSAHGVSADGCQIQYLCSCPYAAPHTHLGLTACLAAQ